MTADWETRAASVCWNIRPFIGGSYRNSLSDEEIDNVNPADETKLCKVPVGVADDVNEAVRISRQRFDDGCWSGLSPLRRGEVLASMANLIARHGPELAILDTLQMGKPIVSTLSDAQVFAPSLLRAWAGLTDKLLGGTTPPSAGTLSFNYFEPVGVVAAITAWNFPLVNAAIKLGPALAAGNSIVLKPSELSSASALKLAELALEAGVPEGVFNVVPGLGATVGKALALHPDVSLLSFTGSTETGRRIMELAGASNGKRVLLECGGKSPHVVFDDVENVDAVADAIVLGLLSNQGQVCNAHTRLIVSEDIKTDLMGRVVDRARRCQPGPPLNAATRFGPVSSPAQRDRIKRYISAGIAAGAEPVLLGSIQETGGCYVSPTIFDCVNNGMSIVREEIFGPVLCVQGFAVEQEAIALANSTEYGLEATVWTRDVGRAKRLARALNVGSVYVRTSGQEENDPSYLLSSEPQKASGFGAELGLRGLESYSTLKCVSFIGD